MNSFMLCSNDLTSFWVWLLIHEESRLSPLPGMGTSLSSYGLLMSFIQLIFACVFHVPDIVFRRDSRTRMLSLPLISGREEQWLEKNNDWKIKYHEVQCAGLNMRQKKGRVREWASWRKAWWAPRDQGGVSQQIKGIGEEISDTERIRKQEGW